ncbi:VWFA and cache domain-containing protein 1-like [Montipora foliosa]|uniref:VWFA and cache domain-containing protein 1-like n=1 Tax=Montipora foliosa TaxID=591990 RepID=UPI0035F2030E
MATHCFDVKATNTFVFLCFSYVILSWQVNGNLLDPMLIGNELQKFARDALGADEMQVYFNGLQYHKKTLNGEDITTQTSIKLADKFKSRFKVARRLKEAVEASYKRAGNAKPAKECCKADKSKLKYNANFRFKVDLENMCLKISGTASPNPVFLDEGVFSEMKLISKAYPFIKWQYFGSEEGVMTNFPVYDDKEECTKYDPRYRPFYVETATPEAKDVVLLIDTSASMTGPKMYIAKEAANAVLDTMNPKDQVGIVSFSSDVSTPGANGGQSTCYGQRLALAIPANIRCLKDYVNGLSPHGTTRYRPAVKKAFNLLKASITDDAGKQRKRVILFLTDGAPSEDEKLKPLFQTIRDMNFQLNNSVVILTFGFGSIDQKTREILQDIAKQNTARYNVSSDSSVGDITPGKFTHVQDLSTLRSEMATYYTADLFGSVKQLHQPVVSVPYVDAFGTGLLISITLPCYHNGNFIGVTGTDINIEDLTSDISLFQNQGHGAYAFMTNRLGRTVVHPLLPAPSGAYEDPVYLDIRALEPEPEFNDVFNAITINRKESKTLLSTRCLPRGSAPQEGVTVRNVNSTYYWTQLEETEFTLGVVVPVSQAKDELTPLQLPKGYKFKYHRIDLDPPQRSCSHFGLLATKDETTVKFAADAYTDTYNYIGKDLTPEDVKRLNAYMMDDTGKVHNPGLRPGIRDTVIATWKVEDLWLRDKTELTQYLVWRYIGTSNGVFRISPGTVSEKGYDHRQRPWYYTALANTGLVSLTTPYFDALSSDIQGAGVVITAARSIFLGEPSYAHHTNDDVLGVMGADFPLTYFYSLLTKVYPICKDIKTYFCFVMNDAGFLIMHEDFLLSTASAADVEYVHITEKEKNIAEHLISRGYLRKRQCRNLKEIQEQSFYEVDLPKGFVNELNNGDSCSKYQLSKIMGTNAYIGVAVRDSMFCVAESCSCSSDRKCSYLSPKCECPCTSPLQFNYCLSQFPNSSLPICPPPAPQAFVPTYFGPPNRSNECDNRKSGLQKCFDPHCSARTSSETCEGIVSCHWCQYDKDDVPLKTRYCASSNVCFRGKEVPGEQPNCDYINKKNKEEHLKENNWFKRMSTEAIVALAIGCIAVGVIIAIVGFILVKRKRRTSSTDNHSKEPGVENRPPAPLPEPEYDDPQQEPPRRVSVESLEWPSPYDEIRVRPKPRRPDVTSVEERRQLDPPGDIQPPPLPQPRKISLANLHSYGNSPSSFLGGEIPHGLGQSSTTNTTRASAGGISTISFGDFPMKLKALPEARTPSVDQDSNLPCLDTHNTVKSISEEPPEIPQKKLKISVGDSEEQNLSTAEGE